MRTDYLGLEAFVAIAELGSFKNAATYLNLTQTALSHRIRKLEANLGVQLLVRTTRELSLTRDAQDLLPQVRRDLSRLSDAYESLRNRGRAQQKLLSFACVPTVAYSHLPAILPQFSAEFPEIAVKLHDQPISGIYNLVEEGEVEFGISLIAAQRSDLHIEVLCRERYVLLIPHKHPLARKASVTRRDLAGQTFARISTQSANRQLVDRSLGDVRDEIDWRYEVQNPAMAMSLVAAGAALTILPEITARLAWDTLVTRRFSDVEMTRTLGVLTRRGMPVSGPGQRMLEMIGRSLVSD
ncbi:LysR family transcriptional regulator [Tropicimonas marinistellae]|uniref:LysR family transcriptional regulator n=1 Tax=Tropicimonas marinistellae TaxID=1739787 RepID=UPI00082CF337|nr:LysR substrate-binding domain-containing protein [Tropicimonas marinistellae]